MKLADYLDAQGLSYAEFARRIDVKGKVTVQRYASGEQFPRKDILPRIFKETGGLVTPNDFMVANG